MSAPLDAATLPLRGVHLIEASAGTGKTFTLANLVLRLLIDNSDADPYTVEQVLVVTFTNAATEELRARIRERVAEALQVLDGSSNTDPSLDAILAPFREQPETRARLQLAYQCMDQAAIFTIHGFCERVLRELAFEASELFDAALQADDKHSLRAAAEAWWREKITPLSRAEIETIPDAWRYPAALMSRLEPILGDAAGCVVPAYSPSDVAQANSARDTAFAAFQAAWQEAGEHWIEQLRDAASGKKISGAKDKYTPQNLDAVCAAVARVANEPVTPSTLPAGMALLGNRVVASSALRKNQPPQHPVGDCVDALVDAVERVQHMWKAQLQQAAHDGITADLDQRHRLSRTRTFDDLLTHVHHALHGEAGDALTAALRVRYPFALIDEFQDTDRVQHGIFSRLYPRSAAEQFGGLYLIGDPKQSIYRFRGADIDVYLRAGEDTDGQHRLSVNWRSSSGLVEAVNTLYGHSDAPFGSADIAYQTVTAAGKADGSALRVGGQRVPLLQFDSVPVCGEKLPLIGESLAALATACARRVVWLLGESNATLGEHPVVAADIAILVRTHKEAELIRSALAERGVSCAVRSPQSVGQSPEARDLLALLRVLAEPGDGRSLGRVLVSPLAALGADELVACRDDPAAWQQIEHRVEQCRVQLHQAGPLAAVLRFMAVFDTRSRAAASASVRARGLERVISNVLHLAELLQSEWQDHPDSRATLQTLQGWIDGGTDGDRLQLRLESDDALVQIVTQHKSKGLQYPIVLLPFVGVKQGGKKAAGPRRGTVAYTAQGMPYLDVGSEALPERERAQERAEADESMRLLYVALTRAEHGCWIGVAANKNMVGASLFSLLNMNLNIKAAPTELQKQIDEALSALAMQSDNIALSPCLAHEPADAVLDTSEQTHREARQATRRILSSWRVGSYSALARGATHAAERPDHDAVDMPVVAEAVPDVTSPFDFPRGAAPGTLVHAVFERVDFQSAQGPAFDALVEQQLRAHGVNLSWAPALKSIVQNTVGSKLPLCAMPLSALARRDRLDELGFHFPVHGLDAAGVCELMREAGLFAADDAVHFDTLSGYMTGFIDLVFRHGGRWYIADYKSNHLGGTVADYAPAALDAAMREHRYDLQYVIYAVALCRYLRARDPHFDPARDFGGVLYLFVRGLPGDENVTAETGVHVATPDLTLINNLDALFTAGDAHG